APGSKKTVIRFLGSDGSTPKLVLKASHDAGGQDALQREMNVLRFLQSRVQKGSYLGFSTPVPLGSFEHAGWHYTTETGVQGQPLSELIFLHSRSAKWGFLRHELLHALESATTVPNAFDGQTTVRQLDASWYVLPHTVSLETGTRAELASEIRRCVNGNLCCHGDFTIENVFWESSSGKISVIDWELPLLGVPALYDVFTLLLSSLPALDLEPIETTGRDRLLGQFRAAFFGTGRWAAETRELLWSLTKGETTGLWLQMLVCLLIRSNYFCWRQPALGEQYARLLEFAGNHRQDFVFSDSSSAPDRNEQLPE
ncbi:MAG TPA: aminoglycoside phosphotransferase family protein, partial [Candidatus Sulfotelmatobacter sp.]|nr:aminoglycoside phosphotransferase family protein [Candidatus Sulfotelmatobacter sp.]